MSPPISPEIKEISQRMAHLAAVLQVYNSDPQVRPLWLEYRDLWDRRKVLEDEAKRARVRCWVRWLTDYGVDSNGVTNGEPVDGRSIPEDEAEPANAKASQMTTPDPSSLSITDVRNSEPVHSQGMFGVGALGRRFDQDMEQMHGGRHGGANLWNFNCLLKTHPIVKPVDAELSG